MRRRFDQVTQLVAKLDALLPAVAASARWGRRARARTRRPARRSRTRRDGSRWLLKAATPARALVNRIQKACPACHFPRTRMVTSLCRISRRSPTLDLTSQRGFALRNGQARSLREASDRLDLLDYGTQRKSYLHVSDSVDAMLLIQERGTKTANAFNIGPIDDVVFVRQIGEGTVAASRRERRPDPAPETKLGWRQSAFQLTRLRR